MTPEDALEYCLKEINGGRKTVAECVALFPELDAELRAVQALRNLRSLTLRPEAERQVETRLRQAMQARSRRPNLVLRWAVASLMTLLVLFGAGAGTISAASVAAPGDALYSVKRAVETVQLSLTPASDRAAFLNSLAHKRLEELSLLVERGGADSSTLVALMDDLAATSEAAIAAVEQAPAARQSEIIQAIIQETNQQQAVLQEVKSSASPQAQVGIQDALSTLAHTQSQALERLGTIDPAARATLVPSLQPTASPTATPVNNAQAPPGQAKAPAERPASSGPPQSPPEPAPSSVAPTHTPPGQAANTPSAPIAPTDVSHGPGASTSNNDSGVCNGNNPRCVTSSENTPLPTVSATTTPVSGEVSSPTACPTNPAGHPKCKP